MNEKLDTITAKNISDILSTHEKLKNSYMWANTGSASVCRRTEFNIKLKFAGLNGDIVEVRQSRENSCKHVNYSLCVKVNGDKKDVRYLKSFLKFLNGATL